MQHTRVVLTLVFALLVVRTASATPEEPAVPEAFVGTFVGDGLELTLSWSAVAGLPPGARALSGTIRHGDQEYPVTARYEAGDVRLTGSLEAVRLYRLAAEQGEMVAQTNLGYLCEHGRGVDRDASEAARWYGMAAAQGFARAQFDFARLLEHGLGVAEDVDEALRWYRLAAEQGNDTAREAVERLTGGR